MSDSEISADGHLPGYDRPERTPDQTVVKLHPDWINIDDLRCWAKTCTETHQEKCAPSATLTGRPEWLIDVHESCIIPAKPEHRYFTLSYVWGQVPSSETTKSNIDELQRPGSLSPSNNKIIVPKTIRHAMGLVRLLDERYLWVDRFCICQDDTESKHSQMNKMGGIYANAFITIIAANGWDADHGLRGIKGLTEPRQISPNFDHDYMESLQPYSTVWYDRGWTFQEQFFSRRKIFFQYQVAVWECCCAVWHEATGVTGNIPTSNYGHEQSSGTDVHSLSPWGVSQIPNKPDLSIYFHFVYYYNTRKLTFPEDGYKAFLGLISTLEPAFPGGFIWGLPKMFFEEALLWVPQQQGTRRHSKKSSILLPSWSWVGWEAPVGPIRLDVEKNTYPDPPAVSDIRPLCQWKWPCDESSIPKMAFGTPAMGSDTSHFLQIKTETASLFLNDCVYWMDGEGFGDKGRLGGTLVKRTGYLKFEAMVISRSIRPNPMKPYFENSFDEELSLRYIPTWCNLILFRRENGIAYRIGVAAIPEKMWVDVRKRHETIILG